MTKDQAEIVIMEFETTIRELINDVLLLRVNRYYTPNPDKYAKLGEQFRNRVNSYVKE